MINISKLFYNLPSFGDELRYNSNLTPQNRRPIVVWNVTRRCNLSCLHCYLDSYNTRYRDELSTVQAKRMIRNLADFAVPVLLFSGGEPFLREDLFELNRFAKELGIRTVISTNGILITKEAARQIKKENFDYVGVSLDGIGRNNDRFRGRRGSFNLALSGIRNLISAGQKTGLRFTITRHNYRDLQGIFKLAEKENIQRVCFYHLVYSGRGSMMAEDDLTHPQMRQCVDLICGWAALMHKQRLNKEILTVDNHCDGAYIYLRLKKKNPQKAQRALRFLRYNGGNSSGIGIANIDNLGFVHADQFWQNYSFGNVRGRDFSEIWQDVREPLMRRLKDRKRYLKGRCRQCNFLDICNGNFRKRAEAVYGDIWQEDPACYLSDEEIQAPLLSE